MVASFCIVCTLLLMVTEKGKEIAILKAIGASDGAILRTFMTEGKIVAMVLEGDDAIKRWRDLMGPTDATKAAKGTIRGDFGTSIERNASHGSDAEDTAAFETAYFFAGLELV